MFLLLFFFLQFQRHIGLSILTSDVCSIVHQRHFSKLRKKKTLRALSRQTCMVPALCCCCWFLFIYCVYRRRSIRLSCASTVQTLSRVFLLIEELTALLKAASFTESFFFFLLSSFPLKAPSPPFFLISIREAEETLLFFFLIVVVVIMVVHVNAKTISATSPRNSVLPVCLLFFYVVVVFPT